MEAGQAGAIALQIAQALPKLLVEGAQGATPPEGGGEPVAPKWDPSTTGVETLRQQISDFLPYDADDEAVAKHARLLREGGFRPKGFAPF